MCSWQISKIDITYPSNSKKEFQNNDFKYYAISSINFNYEKYELQFEYDNLKSVGLVDFTNKKNPKIICEGSISETNELLKKFNLPKFIFDINNSDSITYFVMENDEDGNYDTNTNINSIKSGDYGYPIKYNSNYLINNYDYITNEKEKKEIESIILDSINFNSSKLFF